MSAGSTPTPAPVDQIPFHDPVALERWVVQQGPKGLVTPVVIGRLLEHNGFVEVADLPTAVPTRRVVYLPREATRTRGLADFMVTVYNTSQVAPMNVRAVLATLQAFRAWRVRNPARESTET